ncbi:unnamed protein product [Paramecium sonneborni]|uniref:Uncharacterized protein n=1 Tax=Paramecium sonneborni TaxID=65129 RepID=A0A8S1RMD8_9CILI|nr:unnamed protein product [Paramecium sonneborni]
MKFRSHKYLCIQNFFHKINQADKVDKYCLQVIYNDNLYIDLILALCMNYMMGSIKDLRQIYFQLKLIHYLYLMILFIYKINSSNFISSFITKSICLLIISRRSSVIIVTVCDAQVPQKYKSTEKKYRQLIEKSEQLLADGNRLSRVTQLDGAVSCLDGNIKYPDY